MSFAALIAPRALDRLIRHGYNFEIKKELSQNSWIEEVAAVVQKAHTVISWSEPYSSPRLTEFSWLRAILRARAVLHGVDVAEAAGRGSTVYATPGVNSVSATYFVLALILLTMATSKRIFLNDRAMGPDPWTISEQGAELYSEKVGMTRDGAIGRAEARVLRRSNCTVRVHAQLPQDGVVLDDVGVISCYELLARSEVMTARVQPTSSAGDPNGRCEIALMPRVVVVVNTSLGGVVNPVDTVEAIASGYLSGAGSDFFELEPLEIGLEPLEIADPVLNDFRVIVITCATAFSKEGVVASPQSATEVSMCLIDETRMRRA